MFLRLALHSLLSRKGSVALTFLAISVSIFVVLGIEHIRQQAKSSFSRTVSGADLIVGARTGDINLLLYSVFRLGNATNNISWASYQALARHRDVAWTIPIALGDSHRGYRVMGTTQDYFEHFRYGQSQALSFTEGKGFASTFEVVLGAEVARSLDYPLDANLVLAHGVAATSFSEHNDKPFRVVGILDATGTPVDQTLHISLSGMEALHRDGLTANQNYQLSPVSITAFMLGLKSKMATFRLQRAINNYQREPLLAILPGVTLAQLWQMMAVMENTLRLVSALVLLASLLGLNAMLLTSIRERHREIAIMRTLGAPPLFLFLLIQAEALLITLASSLLALLLLLCCVFFLREYVSDHYSLTISANFFEPHMLQLLLIIILGALASSLLPAIAVYSSALQQRLHNG